MYTVKFINKIKPNLVIHTGDLTQNGTDKEMNEVYKTLSLLESPWYVLMGDHDYDRNQGKYYYQVFKERNHSVGFKGWKLLIISIYPGGKDWLFMQEELREKEPTILFTHRLIYASPLAKGIAMVSCKTNLLSPQWRNLAYRIRSNPQIKMVVSGHSHSNFLWEKDGVYYISTSSLTEVPHQFRVIEVYPDTIETYLYTSRNFQEVKKGKWIMGKRNILPLR